MISFRRKPARARIASALTLLSLCAALLALAAPAAAAPAEGEGPPSPSQLAFEPGSYDFGLRQVNSNASQAYLQLRNDGAGVAPVYSLEIAGPGAGAFWIGQSSCYGATLNPNESCSVQINFGPSEAKAYSAQLRVGSEGETRFSADLSGEGGSAAIGPVVDPTGFGAAAVGSPGVTRTIEIANSGNYVGGVFIAVVASGAIGSFRLLDEDCTGIPLSPEATCDLLVSFQPLGTGVKRARLGLFGDSGGGSQVTLIGIGTEPEEDPEEEWAVKRAAGGASASRLRRHHPRPHRNRSLSRQRRGVANLRPSR